MTYLDTCVVAMLFDGQARKLSREAARVIERTNSLLVSPMVELELDYLYSRQKIRYSPATILSDLQARIGLHICDMPFALVTREAIDIKWTDDPFDKLIVGHAAASRSQLVTPDEKIRAHYKLAVW